jgi:hypothetical protein
MLSAEAENTAVAAAKLIVQPSTLSEAVAGKQKFEGIQEKSILPRQSIEDEDDSIIAPLLFSGEEQTQNRSRSTVRDRVDLLNRDHRTTTPDR